ncbi:Crp/Fnr family transcriptional regulator [Chitinophaga sedimenti]|uniref:Crp/Fnr family transcriptional regulator n=1 Tax=Chitinophaga sedimenti TaxID=2033606 RepID=UPI0020053E9A|nr:Crp/Fnr family transcriptional regulator [Chitinophaga sedimenti]MCK7557953.1 Crp/Fnr family transcriptional regulator [Chitinophaga sedimenti]
MSTPLHQHIAKHIPITPEEAADIALYFHPADYKKKENLITEGQYNHQLFFVVKGVLRMFFITDNGNEQTIQFAIENWWMTDHDAFHKGITATFSVQAIENAEVLCITKPNMEALLKAHPIMERYFRMVYERAYTASLFRVKYIFDYSKDRFYLHFSNAYPEVVQRIPQKILASFLGFTPEYLSELRKKLAKNGGHPIS